ncbi:type II toxin-antitoxin system RelE/ParE family toxin [bacterium]|nr:type II toxin-antitoxin system RelE/ParE family toxin [FCB group bacterium]MBL7191218.1 type II toxin-antitoxin system RelE/ParE family toxin [bacterium]
MKYKIQINSRTKKEIAYLDKKLLQRISNRIDELGENPLPRGTKKLRGDCEDCYRIRIGQYRLLYRIDHANKLLYIDKISHRKEAYRKN